MDFTLEPTENILLLKVKGDLLGLPEEVSILEQVAEHLEQGLLYCIIDITQVNYMNSSGLTILIRLLTRFRNQSGEVVLVGPSDPVSKLLVITKLNAIFCIFRNTSEAVAYLHHVKTQPIAGKEA